MLGRLLVCTIALGTATPAVAGEDAHPAATGERACYIPDALPLLMQDERTTWGTPAPIVQIAPGFNMVRPITLAAVQPMPDNLARFEDMDGPRNAFAYMPSSHETFEAAAFAPATYSLTPGIRLTARARAEPMSGARDALIVGNAVPRPYRPRRSPFDTMLVLRIDGEASSPPLRFSGGVASVLNVIPRR